MHPIAPRARAAQFACALALALVWVSGAHAQEKDWGKARVAGFERASTSLKAMHRLHLPQGELGKLAGAARDIRNWAGQIPSHFPRGSDAADDRARAEIWEDFERFERLAAAMGQRADAVATAAERGDKAAVAVALKALGESCSACHRRFRTKK